MTKVIQFDKSRLPLVARKNNDYCRHMHVVVCEKTRMLECEKCQQMIDPFDYLWEWANKDRHIDWKREALEKEVQELHDIRDELKRQERNIRARIKRLKE